MTPDPDRPPADGPAPGLSRRRLALVALVLVAAFLAGVTALAPSAWGLLFRSAFGADELNASSRSSTRRPSR